MLGSNIICSMVWVKRGEKACSLLPSKHEGAIAQWHVTNVVPLLTVLLHNGVYLMEERARVFNKEGERVTYSSTPQCSKP